MSCPYCGGQTTARMVVGPAPHQPDGWRCDARCGQNAQGHDVEGVRFQRGMVRDLKSSADPETGWIPNCAEWYLARSEALSLGECFDRHALFLLVIHEVSERDQYAKAS